jgi:hypothetical protein
MPKLLPLCLLPLLPLLATACSTGSMVVEKPHDRRLNRAVDVVWTRDVQRVARSGDWILSRSYSMVGDLITATTSGEDLSHATIYDAERGTVIEAISPVVREVPLENLIGRNRYVMVVRPAGLSEEARLASVARARAAVGRPFDYTGVFGLDHSERFYCSELLVWATGLGRGELVVTPSDLVGYGEVIYWSGARDDPATGRAALATVALDRKRDRTAQVHVAAVHR